MSPSCRPAGRWPIALSLLAGGMLSACAGGGGDGPTGGSAAPSSFEGIWVRQENDGSGDETDLAIGNIPGAPASRVWACEVRPASPTAIVIRGNISGDRIRWDAIHGTPDYVISRSGNRLEVDVPGCSVCRRTMYERGAWRNLCGDLDERPTNIFVQFGVWDPGPAASIASLTTALSCVRGPVVGPVHEQCRRGPARFTTSLRVGTSTITATDVVANLARPDSGNVRYYMLGWRYQPVLGRYLIDNGSYVDRPEEGAQLAVIAGNGQQALPGTRLPIAPAVRVTTPTGRPLPGVAVTFDIPGNDPTLNGSIEGDRRVVTDANGIASVTSWTLGREPGGQTLRVQAPFVSGSPLLLSATALVDSVVDIYAGSAQTCVLRVSGTAWCWGKGTTRPRQVTSSVRFTTLALAETATCGVGTDGRAYCWGLGTSGELGLGATTAFAADPTPILGGHSFRSLAGYGATMCGLTTAGAAYCWGANQSGQIGDGTTINRFVPTAVSGGHTFTALTLGHEFACGLSTGGVARCWGRNTSPSNPAHGGQLGDGTRTSRLAPALVSGSLSFTQISAGFVHTCGLLGTGVVRCWGANSEGQIGDSLATPDRLVPTPVLGTRSYTSISSGGAFTCALTAARERWCWGSNTWGQFDIGFVSGATLRGYPIRSDGGAAAPHVAGGAHACFINPVSTERQLRCVGANGQGQLGDGTTISASRSVWVILP